MITKYFPHLFHPIIILTLLALPACSDKDDFILGSVPPRYWILQLVDQDGLNVLNTKDDTFSIIDQLVIEYGDSVMYPNMELVFKDGFSEYFQCDTCCSYYNEKQSDTFWIAFDSRIKEGRECNYPRYTGETEQHSIDSYWNVLMSPDVSTIFSGFTIVWPQGNQRWDVKAEINSDINDCTFYVNGEIVEKFNWPGGEHWFSITITH